MIAHHNNKTTNDQVDAKRPPDFLYTILGPTASGKTSLAIALAQETSREIISCDSRQVYRGMDIGTGKELASYQQIPYHLIDIRDPKDRYDIFQFQKDFEEACSTVSNKGKKAIAVGGTGMYIHTSLVPQPYIQVPINTPLRASLALQDKATLLNKLRQYTIPSDFSIDQSSHKRLIRAIEILEALKAGFVPNRAMRSHESTVFGLNPDVVTRRKHISERLRYRIADGLLDEVQMLLENGLTHADLQYYGLEYKFSSLYLLGELDATSFFSKLETEIHRYAKRQMTFFRKMEKDGIKINWLKGTYMEERLDEIKTLLALCP